MTENWTLANWGSTRAVLIFSHRRLTLPTQTDADTRSLVRSFLDAFPHATLRTTEVHEMQLSGSLRYAYRRGRQQWAVSPDRRTGQSVLRLDERNAVGTGGVLNDERGLR